MSTVDSPVLSSPSLLSALENASPSDVVQLNSAAVQLENVDALLGMPQASASSADAALNNLLAALEAPGALPVASTALPAATSSTASAADQAAGYQAALQQSEAQTLFGLAPTGGSGSLLDVIA